MLRNLIEWIQPPGRGGQAQEGAPVRELPIEFSLLTVSAALNYLSSEPEYFLTHNVVRVIARPSLRSGLTLLYFWRHVRETPGWPSYCFSDTLPHEGDVLGGLVNADTCVECSSLYLETQKSAFIDPTCLRGLRLPLPASCMESFVLTATLTGCSLVWVGEAGDRSQPQCAHISPLRKGDPEPASNLIVPPDGTVYDYAGGMLLPQNVSSGISLEEDLEGLSVRFSDQAKTDTLKIFGAADYQDAYSANVIGIKFAQSLSWELFAQMTVKDAANCPSVVRVEPLAVLEPSELR